MSLFISHSSKDSAIAQCLVDLIIKVFKVSEDQIFCSSLDGHKVRTGDNWINSIHDSIRKSNIALILFSPNYKISEICLAEMGALLLSDEISIIPFLIPPVTQKDTNMLLRTIQLEEIQNAGSLERVKDMLISKLSLKVPKSDYWNNQKDSFIKNVSLVLKQDVSDEGGEGEFRFQRGSCNEYIVDAVFSHDDNSSNIDLLKQLTQDLKNTKERSIDLKYNYLGSISAANWINLSQNPSYGHSKLIQAIRDNISDILASLHLKAGEQLDFISLGSGDGVIDKYIIHELLQNDNLNTFYPFDISFELLQKVVNEITTSPWWAQPLRIKAIHGDFMELTNYKTIFDHDNSPNLFSVLGYTFGNFNEAEFIGKIKEGMNYGDLLLIDARLHNLGDVNDKLSNEEKDALITGYNNESTNRFAFGAIEAVTNADYKNVEFSCLTKREVTVVPNAINILIECKNINTKFRADQKNFKKDKICLGSTTLYSFDSLATWLTTRGFNLIWSKKTSQTGLYLLKR